MKTPVLLTYNLQGERGRRVRLLAGRYKVRVRPVSHQEFGRPIGQLVAEETGEYSPYEGAGFDDEMLIMAHFPSALINRFLDSFRQAGLQSVRLKALMTETNSQWHSAHLHGELKQEAAYFGQLRRMAHEKQQSNPPDPERSLS